MKVVTKKKATEQVATEMTEQDFKEVAKLSKSLGIEKLGELEELYNSQHDDGEKLLDFLRRKTKGAKEEVDVINEAFYGYDDDDDEFADEDFGDDTTYGDDEATQASLSEEARRFLSQEGNHIYTEAIRNFEADFESPSSLAKDKYFCLWLIDNTYFSTNHTECERESEHGETFRGDVDLDDFSKNITEVRYELDDSEPNSILIVAEVELSGSITLYGNEHYTRVYPNDRPDLQLQEFDEETLEATGYTQIRAHLDLSSGDAEFDDAEVDELEYC